MVVPFRAHLVAVFGRGGPPCFQMTVAFMLFGHELNVDLDSQASCPPETSDASGFFRAWKADYFHLTM